MYNIHNGELEIEKIYGYKRNNKIDPQEKNLEELHFYSMLDT